MAGMTMSQAIQTCGVSKGIVLCLNVAMATGIMHGAILLNLLDQYQYLLQNISSFAMTLIE